MEAFILFQKCDAGVIAAHGWSDSMTPMVKGRSCIKNNEVATQGDPQCSYTVHLVLA